MVTMDMSLAQLVKAGKVTLDMALERCPDEEDSCALLQRAAADDATTTFAYKVRDKGGKLVEGARGRGRPPSSASCARWATSPIEIEQQPATQLSTEHQDPGLRPQVKLKDVAVFSRQFATMINSGLSLLRSLAILAEQTESKPLAEVVGRCALDVERGASLSAALEAPEGRSTASTSRWCAPVRPAVCSTSPAAARRHDREAGRAAPQGEVGDDLPGRRARAWSSLIVRDAAVRRPDVQGHLRRARRHAAAADADPDQHLRPAHDASGGSSCVAEIGGVVSASGAGSRLRTAGTPGTRSS